MPNIFKSFLKPAVNQYVLKDVDDIIIEPPPPPPEENPPEPPRELTPEESEEKANADSVISFAKVQADEILADARRQAEELLEQQRQKGEEAAEQARQEAQSEGYRQGYAEGLRQAQVEGAAHLQQELENQAARVNAFLQDATRARENMLIDTRRELEELCLTIAEKVIHVSLKSSRGVIARMIQTATEKLKRREWVHIYVVGVGAKELAQITPELTGALSGLSEHIKIVPMPEDELGTCIVEMPDSIIDASASTQLQNIREILSEN